LKGHDFSRAANPAQSAPGLQTAEELARMKGTGFSPYISPAESSRALAPEGRFSRAPLGPPSSSSTRPGPRLVPKPIKAAP
jgi:hypothetical protein